MKLLKLSTIVIFVLCSGCAGTNLFRGIPRRPESTIKSEVVFHPKKPEMWELANGMKVFFVEDQELPLVKGKLLVPGGSLYESAKKRGLAGATGSQMREGSVKGIKPEALDRELDSLGATIESSFSQEFGSVSFSSLNTDLDRVFSLFSKVIREPSFDAKRLELWRSLSIEGIRRRREEPDLIASSIFSQALYGKNSPYGALSSIESVKSINAADMMTFHRRFVVPNNAVLVVSGAVKSDQLKKLIEESFAKWKRTKETLPELESPKHKPVPGIYVVNRDFDQASIVMGHLGPPRLTEDFLSIAVFNRLFGSDAFGSRLFSEIRSKLGLAYVIQGEFVGGKKTGVFEVALGTRVSEAARAIDEVLGQINYVKANPPSEDEVKRVITAVKRAFVFGFETSTDIANRAALLELLGYPKDYDETFIEEISKIDSALVYAVASTRVHPEESVIVVVGRIKPEDLAKKYGDRLPVFELDFDSVPKFKRRVKVVDPS